MSKYICLCGMTFERDGEAKVHCEIMNQLDLNAPYTTHKIFKQHWQARFATWFFSLPGRKISHFIGGYLIYFVLIHHFHIDWSWWEATLIGVGMGLYIE